MNFESIYTLSSLRARCRKALLTTRLANRWLTLTTRLYCNSLLLLALLLLNCSNRNLDKLQRVQNNLARVVCNSSRLTPAEPLLRSLHWLSVCQRIDYKLTNLCYLAISFHQPVYLAHLIRPIQSVAFVMIINTEFYFRSPAQHRHCCSSFLYRGTKTLELSTTELSDCSIRKNFLRTFLFSL